MVLFLKMALRHSAHPSSYFSQGGQTVRFSTPEVSELSPFRNKAIRNLKQAPMICQCTAHTSHTSVSSSLIKGATKLPRKRADKICRIISNLFLFIGCFITLIPHFVHSLYVSSHSSYFSPFVGHRMVAILMTQDEIGARTSQLWRQTS